MAFVSATFDDLAAVERAVQDVVNEGILPADISIVTSDEARRGFAGADAGRGAIAGGVAGGVLGAILGGALVAATGGASAPLVAAGPLFGVLAGGASGLALGSIVGVLIEAGLTPEEARAVETDARAGRIVLVVRVPDGAEELIRMILVRDGAGVEPGTRGAGQRTVT